MSQLKALRIKGVRSFHPKPEGEVPTIKFEGPLTLITGANGAGKTSVIESLRYATMGESAGQEFVHDPRSWGESQCVAEVGLDLISTAGENITVVRAASLKKRGTGIKYDTVRNAIEHNGSTHREQELSKEGLDAEVPRLLGVSPAILRYVIFCSQSDSTWPIDCNSKELKERFDEIFGASKYGKATEKLKFVIKNLKKKKTDAEKTVAVLNEKNITRTKTKNNLEQQEVTVQRLRELKIAAHDRYNELHQQVEEINQIKSKADQFNSDIKGKRQERAFYQKNIDKLEKSGNLSPELTSASKDDITEKLSQLEADEISDKENLQLSKSQLEKNRPLLRKAEDEQKKIDREISELKKTIDGSEVDRAVLSETLAQFLGRFGSSDYKEVLNTKQNEFRQMVREREEMKSHQKQTHDRLSQKIDKLRKEASKFNSELAGLQEREQSYQKELDGLKDVEANLETAQQNQEKAQQNLDEMMSNERNSAAIKAQQSEIEKQLPALEREISRLKDEKERAQNQVQLENTINLHKSQLDDVQKQMDTNLETVRQIIPEAEAETAKNEQTRQLRQANKDLDEAQKKLHKIQQESTRAQQSLEKAVEKVSEKKAEIQNAIEKITEVTGRPPEDFDQITAEKEAKLQEIDSKIQRTKKFNEMYQVFGDMAQKNCQCPVCKRKFASDHELSKFIEEDIEAERAKVPTKLGKYNGQKEEIIKVLNGLKKLKSVKIHYDENTKSLARDEAEIGQIQAQVDEITGKLNSLELNVKECQEKVLKLAEISTAAELASSCALSAHGLFDKIQKEESQISHGGRLNSEISADLSEKEEAKIQLYQQSSKLNEEYNKALARERDLKDLLKDAELSLKTAKQQMERFSDLTSDLESIKTRIADRKSQFERISGEEKSAKEEKESSGKEIEEQLSQRSQNMAGLQTELAVCEELCRKLQETEEKLRAVDSGDLPGMITEKEEKLRETTKKIEELQGLVKTQEKQYEALSLKMPDHTRDRERLKNDLQRREHLDKIAALDNDIYSLKQKLAILAPNVDLSKADSIIKEEKDAAGELKAAETKYQAEQEHLEKYEEEFEAQREVPKKLNEAILEVKAYELSISDIDQYVKCLDKALVEYHSRKMDEINNTIRAHWDTAYAGNDIDEIRICAEMSTKGNATYNYKVMMHKDGVDLEMRNRCSAGQKMLASLLIRIALAETFAQNCGIIALDEPTTNLDAQNMQNFAKQLNDLITMREDESGETGSKFHMIVISHCMPFVERLASGEFFDHFYRVKKTSDGERHYSEIVRSDRSELGA